MKLTKKVLSIILAAALLVGTVAVAAHAETLGTYEGSVLTYTITSDKDVADGKAEVKPGETITVSVALTTNYYPGYGGGEMVLWEAGIFDDDATTLSLEMADDYWAGNSNFPIKSGALPSDYKQQNEDKTYKYTGFLRTRTMSTDHVAAGTQMSAFDNDVFYTITFTVPEDAETGSVVNIVMPASKVCSATQSTTRTYPIRQNIIADATYVGSGEVKGYSETVNLDSLEITIVGDEPVVEYANLDALKAALDEAATTSTDNCTSATVAEFEAAKKAAQDLYDSNPLVAEQEAVNQAADRLEKAIAALAPLAKVDYDALNDAIEAYEAKVDDKAIYANWAEYEALYNAAKEIDQTVVYDDENGSVQAAVNEAASALADFELVELGKVSYDALNDAIAAYEAKVDDKAIYANWAEYEALYNAAKEIDQTVVYDDAEGSIQAAVNEAASALADFELVELGKVNYGALNDAIAAYEAKVDDKAIYANWAEYEALYNAAKEIDQTVIYDDAEGSIQAAVNEAASALADFKLVELAKVDYDALNDALAAYEAKVDDKAIYANWAEYEALYNAAKEIDQTVVYDDAEGSIQAAVNAAADALANFELEKKTLNYDKWNEAVANIPADLAAYKPASVTAYETAKAAAEADKDAAVAALDQTALDAAADALTAAIALLEEKADNSALAAAVARAQGYVADVYTPDSWAAADFATVIAAAEAVLANGDATAEDIAAQVAAIEAAEAKLVIKADKAALLEALQAAQALVENEAAYTPASFAEANLAAAMADAQAVYEDDNASAEAVAGAIQALKAAEAKLVLKADKAALEAAINTEVVLDNATAETLAAYNEALAAAQEVLDDDNATEDAVLTATNNLLAAIDALDYYKPCDYKAYNDAVAAATALVEDEYTTSSWTAADIAAVLAANAVEEGLMDKDGNQDKIDAAAKAINDAIALLEKKADVKALEDAVAAPAKVAEEYATEETWKAYADAKAAAEALLAKADDLGVSQAQAIADAAQAVVDANAALVEKDADYTAIEDALKVVEEKGDLKQYTQATVKELQKAIDAVVYGLGISRQDDIAKWAEDIVKAANALEVSKAAITDLEVDLSDYIKRETRAYTFTVADAATKVRLITSAGGTLTFDRNHRNVEIVSYNAEGEVINYVDEDPAYEEWTINVSLKADNYQAKAKYGKDWEQFTYDFTVEYVDPAKEEIPFVAAPADGSAEAGKTLALKKNTKATITVTVPNTVIKVQLAFPSFNGTSTYTASNATVVDNGDGTSTWTIVRNFSKVGSYDMVLKLKDVAGWYDAVADAIAVEVVK